ncbi:hypothetical protein KSS82_02035 [Vibrio mimicus]|nr:ABC transporter substrate binding protein [Vibrio mimicus]QXC56045.1 hypothetical protein KSS82_02035 [Vibrio mimicus]
MRGIVFVLLWLGSHAAFAENILVIESYHEGYAWDASYIRGLKQVIGDKHSLTFFEMDTKRIPEREYEEAALRAFAVYQKLKPDLVVLGDDNALYYMLPKLFHEPIPIVFLGINSNPRQLLDQYYAEAQVTGILEQPLFVKNMAEIGRLLPIQKRKVLVLFDSGNTSKIALEYMHSQDSLIKENLGIDVEIRVIKSEQEWHHAVENAPEEGFGAIAVGLYQTLVNIDGLNVPPEHILSWTNQNSTLPLFGFWDFSIGKGKAAGGVVLFGQEQGQMAAEIVLRILDHGEKAKYIPIQINRQGRGIYQPDEFARWGLKPPKDWLVAE